MDTFKKCTKCVTEWKSRDDFLRNEETEIIGYQVDFQDLELGLFLFNHVPCGTTTAIPAVLFKDLYDGPVFTERLIDTEECSDFCLHENTLDACPAHCECAWVREVMQTLRRTS